MPPKTTRRRSSEEEDEVPVKGKTTGTGWGRLAQKKKQSEEREDFADKIKEFWLADGESAIIQFLSPEPFCMEGHSIKNSSGKWMFTPCQKAVQRHCLVCQDGAKTTWRAAFKIIDYRGDWDKDKSKFKHNTKIEKIWFVGETIASSIAALKDSKVKSGDLTDAVFEVSRTGSGKSTSYTVTIARDEETDEKLRPVVFKEQFDDLEVLCRPLSDDALEALGFSVGD